MCTTTTSAREDLCKTFTRVTGLTSRASAPKREAATGKREEREKRRMSRGHLQNAVLLLTVNTIAVPTEIGSTTSDSTRSAYLQR